MNANGFSISFDAWPIVVFRQAGPTSDADLEAAIAQWSTEVRRREGPFGGLHDLRAGTTPLSPTQRRQLTESMGRNDAIAHRCVGHAMVFDSIVMRHLLTAVLWVRPRPYPIKAAASMSEGRDWLEDRLAERIKAPIKR